MARIAENLLIELKGKGVHPETIPWSALTRVVSAIQRIVLGIDVEDEDASTDEAPTSAVAIIPSGETDRGLRLIGIRRGSAVLRVVTPQINEAVTRLRLTGQFMQKPELHTDEPVPIRPVQTLSCIARLLDCEIVVREPDRSGKLLATFKADSYDTISSSLFVHGQTSISGNVQRVGGATDLRCALRLPTRHRLLYCTVDNEVIGRKLGQWLYKDVTVSGEAVWLRTNWEIVRFAVTGIEPPKEGSPLEAIERAWRAGANAWDDIEDPDKFLAKVTGE